MSRAGQKAGLELVFDDGERLDLSRGRVAATVERWLADPEAVPPCVQGSAEFRPCVICPDSDRMAFCHALHPLLPLAERGGSDDLYRAVTVRVAGAAPGDREQTRRTTLQGAMENVALLSLTQYCETGKKYARYYQGAGVTLGVEDFAERIVKNLEVEAGGDIEQMRRTAEQFSHDLQTTSHGQIRRLRLLSKQEPLINAVVNSLILLECLVEEKVEAKLTDSSVYVI